MASSRAPSRQRRCERRKTADRLRLSVEVRSCEPTWTWRPSDVEPERERVARSPCAPASGGRPNFEPWCPVRIASCVSASTPSVTRTSTRRRLQPPPAPPRRARRGRPARRRRLPRRSSVSSLLLPWTTSASPVDPRRTRERELARGGDVRADPLLAQKAQSRDVRERLRPVEDAPARPTAARSARARSADRLLAVDDERRPEPLGERRSAARRRSRARPARCARRAGKSSSIRRFCLLPFSAREAASCITEGASAARAAHVPPRPLAREAFLFPRTN